MKTNIKLFLLCISLLLSYVTYAQNNTNASASNVDLTLLTGLGKHNGDTQITFGINAAILKAVSKTLSFGIGTGYLCNIDYGVEGASSQTDSYIPIFARVKFKTPLSHKSNFVFDCDGGCAIGDNAHALISPQTGFDFKLKKSKTSIATKLMYNNIIGVNSGIWGIAVSLSL
jgi:hypothetical protein